MEIIDIQLEKFRDFVWGAPLLVLLLGTGIYLTFLLRGVQFRYLGYAFRQLFSAKKKGAEGDIGHFEALMTTLAGAIGTGSIVGVTTAVAIGGYGALFWMWVTAFAGMATKYAESLLAVKYREVDHRGEMIGGPMEYIEKGLGTKWLAVLFALFASAAAIGTGNLVQVNAIAESVGTVSDVDPLFTGGIVALAVGLVLLGGVKWIGHVASVLVPFMGLFYLTGGIYVLVLNSERIPEVFQMIFTGAFEGQAAMGGIAGTTLMMTIQMGVSRSVFSNEAGLGISSIAAAAAKTDSPGRQAMITMTGALLSTVIVCTMTGLVLGVTDVFQLDEAYGLSGTAPAIRAFEMNVSGGGYVVTIGLVLFALSTILAWAYYGEKCMEYLLGERVIPFYRVLFTLLLVPGAVFKLETVWFLADALNGLMAIPNLLALLFLSRVILSETNTFLLVAKKERGEILPSGGTA